MIQIEVKKISKSFNQQRVLRDIDFSLAKGERWSLQGASGSGKSTLLHILAALDRPDSGDVLFEGTSLISSTDLKLSAYRNSTVGLVFQFHFLLPGLNCLENIYLPSKIGGKFGRVVKERTAHLIKLLDLNNIVQKFPFQISGGEQQRVNIVRALSLRPKILLCDEPTGNLDSKNTDLVTQILLEVSKDTQTTLLIVTHDNRVAKSFENQAKIEDGQLLI